MDRRQFILSGSAALLAGIVRPAWSATDTKLRTALDAIARAVLHESPMTLTSLGLDKGEYAWAASQLDDNSATARARVELDVQSYKKQLAKVNRAALTGHDAMLYDSVVFCLDGGARTKQFAYGNVGAFGDGNPYVVTQQGGSYQGLPEFLNSQHRIEVAADADAYLARVKAMGKALDNETAQVKHDAGLGVIAPDFALDNAIMQMKAQRAVPAEQARLVASLVRRTGDKTLPGDWAAKATRLVETVVYPALDRQLAALAEVRAKATHDAGVWKLPHGDSYYAWRLQQSTSTAMTPEQVHEMGLEQGAALDARMDALMKAQGMSTGTVGERLAAVSKDPKQLFPNTDAGKVQAVAYVQQQMDGLRAILPRVSKMQLKASVMVKRVPSDIEAGAPLGYMNGAALDGSRPAIYYINLRDTSSWPKFNIPTLSAHEGLPGHSWQFAYLAEHQAEIPRISQLMGFNAFVEGWALYAEQLVDELGFYDKDPLGRLGMLQQQRFRCSRLVVDTGIHAMKWTRDKAVDYLMTSTGRPRLAATSEIDRYCVSPGQACGYKVGHTEIVRLRDKAKTALGSKFDVRDYDDVVVQTGGVPLTVLANVVDDYIKRG